jgi:hypothetical protein
MDGVIELVPGVEYLVKLKVKDVKFFAPEVPNDNKSKISKNLNLLPLPELIRLSGKKNGINCSFFDYHYPWWVGPYKDDRHYDPFYKKGRGSVPHIAYISNNQFHVLKDKPAVPTNAKYIVSVNPVGILDGLKDKMISAKSSARRTIIGSFYDGTFFVYIYNKSTNYIIPRDKVYNLGNVKHAVFLDSGTSTSLIINNKVVVPTGYPGFPNAIVW